MGRLKLKRIIKSAVSLLLCSILLVNFSACSAPEPMKISMDALSGDMEERFNNNRNVVDILARADLITESQKKAVNDNIDKVDNAIEGISRAVNSNYPPNKEDKIASQINNDVFNRSDVNIKNAISAVLPIGGTTASTVKDQHNNIEEYSSLSAGLARSSLADFVVTRTFGGSNVSGINSNLTNWVTRNSTLGRTNVVNDGNLTQSVAKFSDLGMEDTGYTPIDLIGDDSIAGALNKLLDYKIYVLKSDITKQGARSITDVKTKIIDPAMRNESSRDQFFKDTGLTFRDMVKSYTGKDIPSSSGLVQSSRLPSGLNLVNGHYKSDPGYDIIVSQQLDDSSVVPAFAISVKEFNSTIADAVCNLMGDMESTRYVVSKDTQSLYLVEYPVYAINSWLVRNIDQDPSGSSCEMTANMGYAGMSYNLVTRNLFKYNIRSNVSGFGISAVYSTSQGTPVQEAYSSYLSENSFLVLGTCKLPDAQITNTDDSKTLSVGDTLVPKIVLRDYLEASYAPEYDDSTPLVAFGRVMRFTYSSSNVIPVPNTSDYTLRYNNTGNGGSGEICAYYLDSSGNTKGSVYSTDLADISELSKGKIVNMSLSTETPGEVVSDAQAKENAKTMGDMDERSLPHTTLTKSKETPVNMISTTLFPGNIIGSADFNAELNGDSTALAHPRFFCMATKTGLFNSGLVNNWIVPNGKQSGLAYWNTWLYNNGFSYTVEADDVGDYLAKNFSSEMQQYTGTANLNTAAIKEIQERLKYEAISKQNSIIRTIFVLVGFILICMAVILVLLWAVDTNADIGLKLLTLVTFGNWIAVKYETDIDKNAKDKKKYISGQGILIKSIIFIAVGILLVRVDIFALVNHIITAFGGIARWISSTIKGA